MVLSAIGDHFCSLLGSIILCNPLFLGSVPCKNSESLAGRWFFFANFGRGLLAPDPFRRSGANTRVIFPVLGTSARHYRFASAGLDSPFEAPSFSSPIGPYLLCTFILPHSDANFNWQIARILRSSFVENGEFAPRGHFPPLQTRSFML